MNRLRQLMLAWTMYSGQYNDRLLPGFLAADVQQGVQASAAWQVRYKNKHGTELDPLLCQTYPWRLASYLDFGIDPFMGYRTDSEENLDYSSYAAPEIPDNLPASLTGAIPLKVLAQLFNQPLVTTRITLVDGGRWSQVCPQ